MENKVCCMNCRNCYHKTAYCVVLQGVIDDITEFADCKHFEELPEEYRTQAKMLAEMGARKNGNK